MLYRGRNLIRAREIAVQYPGQMDGPALELLQASEAAEQDGLRTRVVAATAVSVALAILVVIAFFLKQRADDSARRARADGLANLSKVVREEDSTRALRIASVAYGLDPESPAVHQALMEGFYRYRWGRSFDQGHPLRALAIAPGGQSIAVGGYGPFVRLLDPQGSELGTVGEDFQHVTDLAFSPDGTHLLVGSYHHGARLYRSDGTFLRTLGGDSDKVFAVAFVKGGSGAIVGGLTGGLARYDLEEISSWSIRTPRTTFKSWRSPRMALELQPAFSVAKPRSRPLEGGPPTLFKEEPRGWGPVRGVGFVGAGPGSQPATRTAALLCGGWMARCCSGCRRMPALSGGWWW